MSQFQTNRNLELAISFLERLRLVATGEPLVTGLSIYHAHRAARGIRIRVWLGFANLEAIGTSEAELEQLLKDAPTNVARKIIERIESDIYDYGDDQALLHVLKSGAEIEVTAEDVASLLEKHQKLRAKDMLDRVRNGKNLLRRQGSKSAGIRYFRNFLDEHQLTLSEVGTSEDELAMLAA